MAMTDAAHGLEAAMAQVQQLIADTQWSSRGLRALQERLAEVHREIARSHSALQGAPRVPMPDRIDISHGGALAVDTGVLRDLVPRLTDAVSRLDGVARDLGVAQDALRWLPEGFGATFPLWALRGEVLGTSDRLLETCTGCGSWPTPTRSSSSAHTSRCCAGATCAGRRSWRGSLRGGKRMIRMPRRSPIS
ncbi:hypothetical protein [Microbacterium sp. NIBRBAC000506063]|uniref:hypothetical protein n=1 Tax=Microbacterium sp. NIBRBAC000506063 TaxID=2734618 RepID=UPI001BB7879F|nr:hypothetical protein [Microbacterium sp. NIBRBAC000506063]QTV80528.1 hypothetical protein KAE78_06530 [Microbacterium sp. NIBRBAC000506063]